MGLAISEAAPIGTIVVGVLHSTVIVNTPILLEIAEIVVLYGNTLVESVMYCPTANEPDPGNILLEVICIVVEVADVAAVIIAVSAVNTSTSG